MSAGTAAVTMTARGGVRSSLHVPKTSIWLRLSLPIAMLAITGSVISLLFEGEIYRRETANWAAQSVGQDIANLLAFPALIAAAWLARRGSTRAYLIWMGLLVYSAYTYAIYAFALHFGPLFLLWVAVFGLSVYALIGTFANLDASSVGASMDRGPGERFASLLLIGIGSVFAVLWVSDIVPSMLEGSAPESLREVGLLTNPVHVLDLALLLPALVTAGVLLRRGRPLGYVLGAVLLVATFFLAIGIVSMMVVSSFRGMETAPVVGVAIAVLAAVEAVTASRLMHRFVGRR